MLGFYSYSHCVGPHHATYMGSDLSHCKEYFCNNIKERYYCDSTKGIILGHEMYNFDLKIHYSWNKYFFFIFIHFVFTTS